MPVSIREAAGDDDIASCRELLREYQAALNVSLCFQGFDRELASLPGDYAPPRGRLWLAHVDGALAGCVALRPIDATRAEMKRLFVRSRFRGVQLGRRLAEKAIETARALGYESIQLDTLPRMVEAQSLYARLGFVEAPRYNDNPVEGVRFMALALSPSAHRAAPQSC